MVKAQQGKYNAESDCHTLKVLKEQMSEIRRMRQSISNSQNVLLAVYVSQ
jgi:hypothetical protein